ncbi:MAG TPA: hypothetical protein VFF63_08535 [Candidatus Babeliales bacterium]|nr:hypothetical protein [Candidatus Babeliales bacterium]
MLTRFLAKLLGLFAVLAALSAIANRDTTIAAMNALLADPAAVYVTGCFVLLIGLAMVIGHNRWSGGAIPVIVTLYGWLALIKGLLFLLPLPSQAQFYQAVHLQQYFSGYMAFEILIGAYLIYGGFRPAARE